MTQLTQHFSLRELVRSETAARLNIDNQPGDFTKANLQRLAENVLQPARDALGLPIRVLSGYRCPRLNRAVGGARVSDHLFGFAADIETVPDQRASMVKLGYFIETQLQFHQLIWEYDGAWIHVSHRDQGNRHQVIEIYRTKHGQTQRPFTFASRRLAASIRRA